MTDQIILQYDHKSGEWFVGRTRENGKAKVHPFKELGQIKDLMQAVELHALMNTAPRKTVQSTEALTPKTIQSEVEKWIAAGNKIKTRQPTKTPEEVKAGLDALMANLGIGDFE